MVMTGRFRIGAAIVLLAGTVVTAGQAQQAPPQPPAAQQPTFKANVEYVEVDAVVTDQQGNFVRNLTRDDFQVSEDGKPQQIATFSIVDIPVERYDRPLYSGRPIEPDVQSNERPFDGRVYVMILDDLHVDPTRTQRVRQSAHEFIERYLGANDLMAVIFTGGRAADAQEFTSSKRLLLNAVDKFMGQKLQSQVLARNQQYFRQLGTPDQGSPVNDPEEFQRVHNAESMLRTLQRVAEWFGGVQGRRKSMLLFSEGIDYDITNVVGTMEQTSSAGSILQDIRDTISATARSNVSIYAVDPRGLATGAEDAIGVSSFADQDSTTDGAGIGMGGLANELRLAQDGLRSLSDESGGFAVVGRNDTAQAFDRIVRDNSSYYVLAYYPPSNNKPDGKFHRIQVRVNRPGLTVRARRGYTMPKKAAPKETKTGGMDPQTLEALNSPLQVSGLTMRVFAAPFKGPQPKSSVLLGVEMSGRDLSLAANSKIDVSYAAMINTSDKPVAMRTDSLTLNLRPETKTRIQQSGIRVLNRVDLPPGRYQIRFAVRDTANSSLGSVIYDLDVPDFYKDKISMSGIAITSLAAGSLMTARPDEQLKDVLPAPPVALRTFQQNDELAIFSEVYDNSGKAPHKVDLVTSILTDEGKVVFKTDDERDSSELQGAKGGYGYTARVPLSDVPPGNYVLTVEARSRLGNDITTRREVRIRVVAPVGGQR
jgi:VWFA-related protein